MRYPFTRLVSKTGRWLEKWAARRLVSNGQSTPMPHGIYLSPSSETVVFRNNQIINS